MTQLEYYQSRYDAMVEERDKAVERLATNAGDPVLNKAATVAYQALLIEYDHKVQHLKGLL